MFGFTTDQVLSLARTILKMVAGFLVAKGLASPDVVTVASGAIIGTMGVLFSFVHHTLANSTQKDLLPAGVNISVDGVTA